MGVNKIKMADPGGFEPPTPWFEVKYSIQLSYGSARSGLICCFSKCKKIQILKLNCFVSINFKLVRNLILANKVYTVKIFK